MVRHTLISRRSFLGSGALGMAAFVAACSSDGTASPATTADPTVASERTPTTPATPSESTSSPSPSTIESTTTTQPAPPKSVLAVVGGRDIDGRVRRAVELAGGLDEIEPGDTVFIKPNAVYSAAGTTAIITSLEVLGAVIRLVKEYRPGRIIVGDRSARQITDQDLVLETSGMQAAALAAGADEVYPAPSPAVDPDAWVLLQPPLFEETWSAAGGVLAMRKIIEADHLINVPVCKNHRYAGYSLSMKNFIGAVGDSARDVMHYTAGDPERLSRDIALLNQMFTPLISILDATDCLINGGPEGLPTDSVRTSPALILASRDRIALDAGGVSLIKLGLESTPVPVPDQVFAIATTTPSWAYPQIRHGSELGLGVARAELVDILFDGVDDAARFESVYRAV
jgi:uncharacterized protein (DUF362 family)